MSRINVANFRHPDGTDDNINLDSSGRVGVGTTSPASKLHVYENSASPARIYLENTEGRYEIKADANLALHYSNQFVFNNAAGTQEFARILAGRLLVGTASDSETSTVTIQGNSANSAGGPLFKLRRGTNAPTNNAALGVIRFEDSDGGVGATFEALRNGGTWTTGSSHPTKLVFSTTADGSPSPTARIIINQEGTMFPATDNAFQAGSSGFRWTAIYAVNGTIQTSDARQKTDVSSCSLGSAFIKSLQPVSFKWIEGGNTVTKSEDGKTDVVTPVPGERTHWGFLAQDVKAAVDDAGVDFGGWILTDKDDPDSAQGLRYDQFIAPLTKALQEALAEIDVLNAKVAALEAP